MITKSFETVNEIINFVNSVVALSDGVYSVQTSFYKDSAFLTFLVNKDVEFSSSKAKQLFDLCYAYIRFKGLVTCKCDEPSDDYPTQFSIFCYDKVRG